MDNLTTTDGTVLDPKVVKVMRTIRSLESNGDYNAVGDSGRSKGAYQWHDNNWKTSAKSILGDENAPMTPANQNKVAYHQIKSFKDAGRTPEEIDALWNGAHKDTATGMYVHNSSERAKKFRDALLSSQTNETPQAPPQTSENNGASFPINENDSALQAGAKALGNVPSSTLNFAKGAVQSLNPINTVKNLAQIPSEFQKTVEASGGVLPAIGNTLKEIPGALYHGLVPSAIQKLIKGDVKGAAKGIGEDPIGQIAPLVLAAEGGAKLADNAATKSAMAEYAKEPFTKQKIPTPTTKYSDAINTGIQKTAGLITSPFESVGNKIGNLSKTVGQSIASQLTGLDPQSMQQILSNPKEFSKLSRDTTSRGGLAGDVFSSINERIKNLGETGKEYDPIRQQTQLVPETTGFIEKTLEQNGLRIEKGKIKSDSMSSTRNPADLKAIQGFYDNWGKRVGLTPSEFLNMRSDLADLAKYDKLTGTGKTPKSQIIADQLRQQANKTFRKHIMGLDLLDSRYSEETQFLKKVKKDYLNPDGTFKDGAINKIANATGSGKTNLLHRLEQVTPGITKRIKLLKAVEDIERANGIKIGTYTRGALQGGAILTGNVPALIATIMTSPESAVQILRAAGYVGSKVTPIVNILKTIGGDVNSLKGPIKSGMYTGLIQRQSTTGSSD